MGYAHLNQEERYQIQHLHRGGFSSREIAEQMDRDRTTLSRELRRNADSDGYAVPGAHRQSLLSRHAASSQSRIDAAVWSSVDALRSVLRSSVAAGASATGKATRSSARGRPAS